MATEKRLIDPDEFLRWLVKRFKCVPLVGSCDRDSESMKLLLAQAPTVDAVEVVRCKDCKNWCYEYDNVGLCTTDVPDIDGVQRYDVDFCSYGRRKERKWIT